jgi:hypothetical protein
MLEFLVNSLACIGDKGETPPLLPTRRLDSSGRCSRYTCAPGKWGDSKSWC